MSDGDKESHNALVYLSRKGGLYSMLHDLNTAQLRLEVMQHELNQLDSTYVPENRRDRWDAEDIESFFRDKFWNAAAARGIRQLVDQTAERILGEAFEAGRSDEDIFDGMDYTLTKEVKASADALEEHVRLVLQPAVAQWMALRRALVGNIETALARRNAAAPDTAKALAAAVALRDKQYRHEFYRQRPETREMAEALTSLKNAALREDARDDALKQMREDPVPK